MNVLLQNEVSSQEAQIVLSYQDNVLNNVLLALNVNVGNIAGILVKTDQ